MIVNRHCLGRIIELFSHSGFIWTLSRKELKNKYSGSRLGIWWAVILPLLLALSISLIFTKAFRVEIPNYTFFVLSAILPWTFFSQSLSEVANSFIVNKSLLRQGVFPREIIPVSSIVGNFLNFSIGFIVISPIFIITIMIPQPLPPRRFHQPPLSNDGNPSLLPTSQ